MLVMARDQQYFLEWNLYFMETQVHILRMNTTIDM